MENELPAKLALVEIDGAAARDAAYRADAVLRTILQVDFPAQVLVPADQCGRRKAQEANRVGYPARLAFFDQRGIERDIGAAFAHTRIDDPECG